MNTNSFIIYNSDIPCECGEYNIQIKSDFVGFFGDKPCYEDCGVCPLCGKVFNQYEISQRFLDKLLSTTHEPKGSELEVEIPKKPG